MRFKRYANLDKVWGWITNDYEFIPTSSFGHIDEIIKHPKFIQAVPEYKEWEGECEETRKSCQYLEDTDAELNAEWHNYEIDRDNMIYNIYKSLYENGWIRIGTWGNGIHFEGKGWALASKKEYLKDFSEERDMEAYFEPRK